MIFGNFVSSLAYVSVEIEMAPRCGALSLAFCSGVDRYVSAFTRRLPLRSTRRELTRKKSAPSNGQETSVTIKFHYIIFVMPNTVLWCVPHKS